MRNGSRSYIMIEFGNNIFHYLIFHALFVNVGQRLKRLELYFSLGESEFCLFFFSFGSFSSVHYLALLWKLVSLIFLSLVYTLRPLSLSALQSGSFINASLILAAKRLAQPGIPRELQPFQALPLSFIPYSRSLFGIQQVSSSNVAHFLPDTHKHIYQAQFASPAPSVFFANGAHAFSSSCCFSQPQSKNTSSLSSLHYYNRLFRFPLV